MSLNPKSDVIFKDTLHISTKLHIMMKIYKHVFTKYESFDCLMTK